MSTFKEVGFEAFKVEDRVTRALASWLYNEPPDFIQLVKWLEGYSWPVADSSEPYLRLLHGFRKLDTALSEKFVLRVIEFLAQEPERQLPGDRPYEVLYNLLRLCGGMNRPDKLSDSLRQMLARKVLNGDFEGANLRAVLRDALIRNQVDNTLLPVWRNMACGGKGFLPGDIRDAVEGIVRMPLAAGAGPDPDAVGWVLERLTEHLEKNSKRNEIFADHLQRVVAFWGVGVADEDFIELGRIYAWPQWAREIAKNFDRPIRPARTPSRSPRERVIHNLEHLAQNAPPAQQEHYRQICIEVTQKILAEKDFNDPIDLQHAEENKLLIEMEDEYEGDKSVVDAIQRGRWDHLSEKELV